MLAIEKDVCGYDLACQLVEAGYKPSGMYWWVEATNGYYLKIGTPDKNDDPRICKPTFSIGELINLLPTAIVMDYGVAGLYKPYITKQFTHLGHEKYLIWYAAKSDDNHEAIGHHYLISIQDDHVANCLAKTLLGIAKNVSTDGITQKDKDELNNVSDTVRI